MRFTEIRIILEVVSTHPLPPFYQIAWSLSNEPRGPSPCYVDHPLTDIKGRSRATRRARPAFFVTSMIFDMSLSALGASSAIARRVGLLTRTPAARKASMNRTRPRHRSENRNRNRHRHRVAPPGDPRQQGDVTDLLAHLVVQRNQQVAAGKNGGHAHAAGRRHPPGPVRIGSGSAHSPKATLCDHAQFQPAAPGQDRGRHAPCGADPLNARGNRKAPRLFYLKPAVARRQPSLVLRSAAIRQRPGKKSGPRSPAALAHPAKGPGSRGRAMPESASVADAYRRLRQT